MDVFAPQALENRPPFEILYIMALPDWEPYEVTPFQGFAPGLISFVPFFQYLPGLPSDLLEPMLSEDVRLVRRRAGSGGWTWSPVNLSTLISKRKPTTYQPYMVVLTADRQAASAVSDWRRNLRIRPIHLSLFAGGGAIHPAEFTQDMLRLHLISLMKIASQAEKRLDFSQHGQALSSWKPRDRRPSSLVLHSHNVTVTNEMVLLGAGELPPTNKEGHLNVSPHEKYVQGITDSAKAVMALWPPLEAHALYDVSPRYPDLFLVAPSTYKGISKQIERKLDDQAQKMALRALDRQTEYTSSVKMQGDTEEDAKEHMERVGPILGIRGAELKLTSLAIGMRTASTVAATIRLPPAVNRTAGVVGQLSTFLRAHENPPPIKSSRVFRVVQDALLKTIPAEHMELIKNSKDGVKIIADAPIEWLPVDGLPLGIRNEVSRINPVPGNLFMQQVRPPMPIRLSPDDFRDYLVLSMFDDGDPIAPYLRSGVLNARDGDGRPIIGKFASPNSPEEFAREIAAFRGPMLIVDSHGSHGEGDVPGGLIIGGAPFDVWNLAGKIRMPPIVILSACDTHPFDRSHATIANGFIACGAMAVVGTALPVRALKAARTIMRLINRAVHYSDIVNGNGRAVLWSSIVTGVLRMDFAADIVWGFQEKGYFDEDKRSELQLVGNLDLNPLNPDWFERLKDRVYTCSDVERALWDRELADIIAGSDSIRYLHLGNPEAITIGDERTFPVLRP